jgi:hypothetical protein
LLLGLWQGRNITVEGLEKKTAHPVVARKQREKEEGAWEQDISFKDVYPVTYFLQLGPTF